MFVCVWVCVTVRRLMIAGVRWRLLRHSRIFTHLVKSFHVRQIKVFAQKQCSNCVPHRSERNISERIFDATGMGKERSERRREREQIKHLRQLPSLKYIFPKKQFYSHLRPHTRTNTHSRVPHATMCRQCEAIVISLALIVQLLTLFRMCSDSFRYGNCFWWARRQM